MQGVNSGEINRFSKLYESLGKFWGEINSKKNAVIALILVYCAAVIFTIIFINPLAYGPSHFGDEVTYWKMALSFFNGDFSLHKHHHSPPLYSLSLMPAFYFFFPGKAYAVAKILNAFYFTSAIFPSYLLTRQFLSRNKSLAVAAFLLLNPAQIIFPGRILSENIFFPLLMWAILISYVNFFPSDSRNRKFQDFLLGILITLLFLTRYIGLVMIPALLLVWWLKQDHTGNHPFSISREKISGLVFIFIPITSILGLWVFAGLIDNLTIKEILGFSIASNPLPEQLTIYRLMMWIIFYLSYTILLSAPFLPFLINLISNFNFADWREGSNRWMISLLIIIFFLLVACIRHSMRASYNYPDPEKLQGRYIFFFSHLFLITASMAAKNDFKANFRFKSLVLSSILFLTSYAILYWGIIFIDYLLKNSASSPFGGFISLMGFWYVFLTLLIAFSYYYLSLKRMRLSLKSLALLFCFFSWEI